MTTPYPSIAHQIAATRVALNYTKSINEIIRFYRDRLLRIAFDALNGRMTAIDFRRAHKALIADVGKRGGIEGWREGGGNEDDFGSEQRQFVSEWVVGQQAHVNNFAAWIVSADANGDVNTEAKRAQLSERVEWWIESFETMIETLKMMSLGDPYLTFDGQDGEESCDECQEYKGQRHRLSWWLRRDLVRRNGNENYGCGRWHNCHHHFYDDEGRMVIR